MNSQFGQQTKTMSSLRSSTLSSIAMIGIISLALVSTAGAQLQEADNIVERQKDDSDHSNAMASADQLTDHQLTGAEPRQQFKVHLIPSSQASARSFKFISGLSHVNRRAVEQQKNQQSSQDAQLQSTKQKQPNTKTKISNAKLKKLLNQSLTKTANGTLSTGASSTGTKGSNFKFVFIQRATAAPSGPSTKSTATKTDSTKKPHPSSTSTTLRPQKSQSQSQLQQSLAASVSKQLASSLFYTATSLMSNLTSAPSLTSLVAQSLASGSLSTPSKLESPSTKKPADSGAIPSDSSSTLSSPESGNSIDLKRISSADSGVKKSNGYSSNRKPGSIPTTTSTKTSAKKSRPSKIYNIPVKFVANGQPNHIVFETIKNHFATIKKLQSATSKLASMPSNGIEQASTNAFRQKKRKGQQQLDAGVKKLKGVNSRLIYLPLRYLSNARPNKLLLGAGHAKATHKSIS